MNRANSLRDEYRFNGIDSYKQLLIRAVRRHRGQLTAVAWDLNVSVRNLRRHLLWAGLWDEVEAAKKLPPLVGSDPLALALQKL